MLSSLTQVTCAGVWPTNRRGDDSGSKSGLGDKSRSGLSGLGDDGQRSSTTGGERLNPGNVGRVGGRSEARRFLPADKAQDRAGQRRW